MMPADCKHKHDEDQEESRDNENRLGELTRLLQPSQKMDLLDIGCGNGKFIQKIAAQLNKITAVDGHAHRIEEFQERITADKISNVTASVMDAHKLEFPDNSFDAVTCHSSYHHFSDGEAVLREISRVLKSGGMFIVNDRISPDKPDFEEYITALGKLRDSTYERTFTKLDWERLLKENDFTLESLDLKRIPVITAKWLGKPHVTQEQRDKILDFLASAPLDVKEYFKIEIKDGSATQFDNEGIWIKARRN